MHSDSLNDRMLALVEDILLREVTSVEKKAGVVSLITHCRYRVTWRVSLHSATAVTELWNGLELVKTVSEGDTAVEGVTQECVISMVNEWMFRSKSMPGYRQSDFINSVVESLTWASMSESLPGTITQFVGDEDTLASILEKNPWALFLYLVGMTDGIKLVANHYPIGAPPV